MIIKRLIILFHFIIFTKKLSTLTSFLFYIHFHILLFFFQKFQKRVIMLKNFLVENDYDLFLGVSMADEPETYKFIIQNIKKCKVFVDVGAYIGGYSIRAAKYCKVYAIEPLPRNYKILKINEKLNNVKINSFNIAAGNKNVKVKLYYDPWNLGLSSTKWKKKKSIEVEMKPLDEIINEESIDLIKIDVEGAEDLVLEGARNCLKRTKMVIIERSDSFPKAYRILREEGFRLIKILDDNNYVANLVFIRSATMNIYI